MKATTRKDEEKGRSTQAFFTHNTLEELAKQQGVEPVSDPSALVGDFWPEHETAEEFIATLRQWRKEENNGSNGENT